MKSGAELILEERQRQIESEGYDEAHDSQYDTSALGNAGICYAVIAGSSAPIRDAVRKQTEKGIAPTGWPWGAEYWKPGEGNSDSDRVSELVKSGALIAAEIDRIQRRQ